MAAKWAFLQVQPLGTDGKPISDAEYTRSGLLGFLGPGGLVFVCGSRDGLMTVTGKAENTPSSCEMCVKLLFFVTSSLWEAFVSKCGCKSTFFGQRQLSM